MQVTFNFESIHRSRQFLKWLNEETANQTIEPIINVNGKKLEVEFNDNQLFEDSAKAKYAAGTF